jgi:leucyl-tRNA synthetase
MIQGRSNFVYRLELKNLPANIASPKNIFISKDILDIIMNDRNSLEFESLVKKVKEKYDINITFETDLTITKLNVDVNIVVNDILDKERFLTWRPELNEALFMVKKSGEYLCGYEVEKMSKSKYNVVTPDDIAEKFGSDTLRLYEMFLGPLEQSKPWNTNGITGVNGFLKKLWRLFYQNDAFTIITEEPTKAELKTLHKTIKKITEDIERFSFNTSVSNFMICVNELTDLKCNKKEILEPLLICLSPYAPHITEELWKQLGHTESIAFAPFPIVNETFLIDDSINYPVSVNGKLKFTLELPAKLTKEEVEVEVMKNEQTIKLLAGQQPKKVIVVHKKIVNMVV